MSHPADALVVGVTDLMASVMLKPVPTHSLTHSLTHFLIHPLTPSNTPSNTLSNIPSPYVPSSRCFGGRCDRSHGFRHAQTLALTHFLTHFLIHPLTLSNTPSNTPSNTSSNTPSYCSHRSPQPMLWWWVWPISWPPSCSNPWVKWGLTLPSAVLRDSVCLWALADLMRLFWQLPMLTHAKCLVIDCCDINHPPCFLPYQHINIPYQHHRCLLTQNAW